MTLYYESELQHHGIKGQKWGVRRYQKKDGTLTSAGKKRSKRHSNIVDDRKADSYTKKFNKSLSNIRTYSRKQRVYEHISKNSERPSAIKDFEKISKKYQKKVDHFVMKHNKLVDDIYDSGYEVREIISSGEYYVSKK